MQIKVNRATAFSQFKRRLRLAWRVLTATNLVIYTERASVTNVDIVGDDAAATRCWRTLLGFERFMQEGDAAIEEVNSILKNESLGPSL